MKSRFLFHIFFIFLCTACLCTVYVFLFAEEFIYDSHGKRDPFSPQVVVSVEKVETNLLADIRVEGIMWDDKTPMAVINDKIVGVGDVVSGARVVEIKQNEVIFDINGQVVSVKLREIEVEGL